MRLLADENCPRSLVEALRGRGHDVAWVREDSAGASDRAVLSRARRERRVIVTFDKGFGELAFRERLPTSCGVLLLRLGASSPDALARRALEALALRRSWSGVFATVTGTELRIRRLPPGSERRE